jgi:hypothetical protein
MIHIVTHVVAWMVGVCAGFLFAAWLLLDPVTVHAGEPKYQNVRDLLEGS